MSYGRFVSTNFANLIGKTLTKVTNDGSEIHFYTDDGQHYMMYHDQECCEGVYVDSIDGDLNALVGSPIVSCSESSDDGDSDYGVLKWTFYRIRTDREFCHITWRGESNGYYSTSVSFARERSEKEQLEDDSYGRNWY